MEAFDFAKAGEAPTCTARVELEGALQSALPSTALEYSRTCCTSPGCVLLRLWRPHGWRGPAWSGVRAFRLNSFARSLRLQVALLSFVMG